MTKKRGMKSNYGGNCRMIEIGSPNQPFRLVFNVDHIDSMRFEARYEDVEVPIPETEPPRTETQNAHVGWAIIVTSNSNQSGINFSTIEDAMHCYNSIIGMIRAVGVPSVFMSEMRPPEPPPSSEIVGPDGKPILETVDAADLYPDLAGGPGAGMAENDDDEDFDLSDEDIAMLENPEIDVEGMEDVFADPEDPPAKN